ncbi:hypothetical protein AAL_01288 [Moelleriella libera RCEF 2490]|uniref:F-box domain-containing protein n=1 Tax=Moelleriella libera RCEF 2490 TaxID=1081109 RepID=A0A166VMH7_9HYPO|nr:hypothetical protein AAL_01288 [Moelleriella libera RCEF 2490]
MVQVLIDPALTNAGEHGDGYGKHDNGVMSREEHAQRMKALSTKRAMTRAPRRGWSLSEYQGDENHQFMPHYHPHYISHVDRQASIPENAVLQSTISRPGSPFSSAASSSTSSSTVGPMVSLPLRTKMKPPRRSLSVTDKEPELASITAVPAVSAHMNLLDLPSELHYTLFDFLDPIDGACLGLAHSHLYMIHQRKNGRVPLCSRYAGPNDMEWAWRRAGTSPTRQTPSDKQSLERLRVKGQVYCRKCGISRCELHRHLRDWMGHDYEYCEIRKVYGRPADESAKPYCFLSSPKNPHRCGRHGHVKLRTEG